MKREHKKLIPGIVVGAALLTATATADTASYDFDDGPQGWTNVQTSTTNSIEFISDTNTQGGKIDQQYAGDGSLRPDPFADRDAEHSVALWMRSPAFGLTSSNEISFGLIGGTHGSAPASDADASLTTASTGSGWQGMVLRRVSDGAFILSGNRSGNGQDTHETISWDAATVAAAISGDDPTETYTLDLIDSYSGGWGWLGADDVLIGDPPAIIDLADASLTGVDTVVSDVTDMDIVGEDSIYIAGTFTFNAVDITQSVVLTEVQIAGQFNAYRIGQATNTNDFNLIKPTVSVLDDTLTVGESHSVVIKMDTLTGAYSVWLDPNLGLPEASNLADVTGSNATGIGTLEQVQFRTNGSADADFTGFALYTGATTPFGTVPEPFAISITPNASTPGNYDFEWDSQVGKLYDLVSDTVLGTTAPADWPVWLGNANIPSGGTTTSLMDIPGGGDPTRFFAVVEKNPPPLFSEYFETDNGGFSATGTPDDWAWGTPNSNNGDGLVLTTGNGASQKCWGTNLGDGSGPPSGMIDTTADSILRSPDIDLTGSSGAQLQFAAAVDAQTGDTLEVLIREVGTDTQLGSTIVPVTPPVTSDWANFGPFNLSAADNQNVYLEFRFKGTDDAYIGFYLDDVVITEGGATPK